MTKVKHTVVENEKLLCLNCGGDYKLQFPMPIDGMDSFAMKVEYFNKLHGGCKPGWIRPEADQSKTIHEKAMWWMNNGQVGMSSKTMWNCFMNNKDFPVNHPYDPDDFSRCYKLLKAVPEWKSELHRLKNLSKAWSNLVDNWDKLTEMYEQNVREEWKNSKKVGMYEFMSKLI